MTDAELALLAAIRADPDDESARRAYGEILTQRGDPRGDYIRLLLEPELDPDQEVRVAELEALEGAWARELGVENGVELDWNGGFPDGLTGTAVELYAHRELLRTQPIRSVRITEPDVLGPLASELLEIRVLSIRGASVSRADIPLAFAEELARAHLPTLWFLSCLSIGATEAAARAIGEARWFPQVTTLTLAARTPDAAEALLARASALRRVDMTYATLGARGGAALAARELYRLRLAHSNLGEDGSVALFESETMPALNDELRIEHDYLGRAFDLLVASPPPVVTLGLIGLGLESRHAARLAGASFPRLQKLHLQSNRFDDTAWEALAASATMPALREVVVGERAAEIKQRWFSQRPVRVS